jgi:uncharacterized membrane protein YcaP (DUF421 family)
METVIYCVLGYLLLLLVIRVLSRRPGAQITPFEFVLVFLIGGVIILAVTAGDHSLTNCFCAVVTVGLMHRFTSYLRQRFPRVGALVDGTPLVLLKDGQWQTVTMGTMRIQDTDVLAVARTKGLRSISQVEYAVLERNGSISIFKKQDR